MCDDENCEHTSDRKIIAKRKKRREREKKRATLLRNEANDAWIPEQTIWERDWTAYLLSSTNQDIRIPYNILPAHRSQSLALLWTHSRCVVVLLWLFMLFLGWKCFRFWSTSAILTRSSFRFFVSFRIFFSIVVKSQCLVLSVNWSRMENWIFIKCQCIHNGIAHKIHFKWGKERFDSNYTIQYCTRAQTISGKRTLSGQWDRSEWTNREEKYRFRSACLFRQIHNLDVWADFVSSRI